MGSHPATFLKLKLISLEESGLEAEQAPGATDALPGDSNVVPLRVCHDFPAKGHNIQQKRNYVRVFV